MKFNGGFPAANYFEASSLGGPFQIGILEWLHIQMDEFEVPLGGNIAATVSRPSGGEADFLETNFGTCSKLQKVLGLNG